MSVVLEFASEFIDDVTLTMTGSSPWTTGGEGGGVGGEEGEGGEDEEGGASGAGGLGGGAGSSWM